MANTKPAANKVLNVQTIRMSKTVEASLMEKGQDSAASIQPLAVVIIADRIGPWTLPLRK